MIELTKMNGSKVLVNCDLIRTVEATPDTVIRFSDGETLMVREKTTEVSAKVLAFKRSISSSEVPAWT